MRATFLNFRNPKEETPPAYVCDFTSDGAPLRRYNYKHQSESRVSTMAQNQRFATGSIYQFAQPTTMCSTTKKVGPGAYREELGLQNLRRKPCMTKYVKPAIAPNEQVFEMIDGTSRFLQTSYMQKKQQQQFEATYDQVVEKLGRKVNKSMIYRRTMTKEGSRRNDYSYMAISPVQSHISRIRNSHRESTIKSQRVNEYNQPKMIDEFRINNHRRTEARNRRIA